MKNRERQRANRRLKRAEEKVVKCDLHNCAGNKSGYPASLLRHQSAPSVHG